MTTSKKIGIGIIITIIFLVLVNIGLNFWIKKQLPLIIHEKNKTAYHINYDKIEVSLFTQNIQASTLLVHPKDQLENSKSKTGIFSKIASITIKKFNIWDLVFHDIIRAESIIINNARIILYKKNDKLLNESKNIKKEIVEPFQKIVSVSNIYLNDASIDVVSLTNTKPILKIKNIILKLEGILITDATLKEKIPLRYQKYVLVCDSLYYKPNTFYHITVGKISSQNNFLKLNHIAYIPEYNRPEFVQKLHKEKDIYTIKLDSAHLNNMKWGFKKNRFYLNATSLVFHHMDANIYRNKIPTDDLSKKYLYSTLLRKIKFPLKIDSLHILNSKLVYEEEIDFKKGPAVLTFDHFNLKAQNIQSGFGLQKVADVSIKVDCRFMKKSPLHVAWRFNVLDKNDRFHIAGNISHFDVNSMSAFTKPYLNATLSGNFSNYSFDFYGNDTSSKGNATLLYDNLKISLYKKDREKKAKLKSALANLIIKNDSKEKKEKANIEIERIPEKSFYNLLWRSIAATFKEILL